MVHTTSAIAVAVLALSAASALAAPSYEYSDEIAARDYEDYEVDARDVFDFEEFDAREFDEYDAEAREFDFGDVEEREFFEVEQDLVERATSTTSTPTATTTTHVVKPTGKSKTETKTVVVTSQVIPKKCSKASAVQRLKNLFRKKTASRRKRSNLRAELRKAQLEKELKRVNAKLGITQTFASAAAKKTATPGATLTLGSEWSQITPPPRKSIPKGVKYTDKKSVGKDKVTTISRTVTAVPTPCPTKDSKKSKRELDFEDVMERSYEVDELD
jgi:hypothetical protein